jgi:uncharacterized protein YciI
MKKMDLPFYRLLLIIIISSIGFNLLSAQEEPAESAVIYDSIAAKKFGADEYGMRKYVMAFLKAGPNRDRSPEEAAALQKAHLQNIGRLAKAGKLALAGPFLDDGTLRGIYIFNVETVEEAEALTNTDPAVQAGSLVMELRPWYGSAALMMVNEVHETLSKESITD